jgi:hypothetical protein
MAQRARRLDKESAEGTDSVRLIEHSDELGVRSYKLLTPARADDRVVLLSQPNLLNGKSRRISIDRV